MSADTSPDRLGDGVAVTRGDALAHNLDRCTAALRAEGLSPHSWRNGPGERYPRHSHSYHKVLYCVSGGIGFHTDVDGVLGAGDRLDLSAEVAHSATVGDDGVVCVEAARL